MRITLLVVLIFASVAILSTPAAADPLAEFQLSRTGTFGSLFPNVTAIDFRLVTRHGSGDVAYLFGGGPFDTAAPGDLTVTTADVGKTFVTDWLESDFAVAVAHLTNGVDDYLGLFGSIPNVPGGSTQLLRESVTLVGQPGFSGVDLAGSEIARIHFTLDALTITPGVSGQTGTSYDVTATIRIDPVPEPASIALVAGALGILAWRVRRRS